jgi:hypothetical protein
MLVPYIIKDVNKFNTNKDRVLLAEVEQIGVGEISLADRNGINIWEEIIEIKRERYQIRRLMELGIFCIYEITSRSAI